MKDLPLATIPQTKENYLKMIKPLLNEKEFLESKEKAEKFFSNQALELQDLLEMEKTITGTSWIYRHWLNMYLSTKGSVTIDSNFCLDLKLEKDILNQTNEKILNLFSKSLGKICKDFMENSFEPIIDARGNELCDNQFQILKGASRIPMINKDIFSISNEEVNYMTILYKNNLYKLELFNTDGFNDLEEAILNIINHTKDEDKLLPCISFFPTAIAGKLRDELYFKNQFFQIIENSLFNISLIDEEFSSYEEKRHYMLYLKGENSWVFKPLNFIFNLRNKDFYVNADHTFEDAGTVIEIIRRTFQNMNEETLTQASAKEVMVNEYLTSKDIETIKNLKNEYLISSNKFFCKNLDIDFSNEECLAFSKDAIMQMIMLYAHYKTYDKLNGIYEAVDMREYAYGRTECVRVLSSQAVDFVKALDDNSVSKDELLNLLNLANTEHKTRIKDAKKSEGIDRHLFGLKAMVKKLSEEKKKEALEFFEDKAYKRVTQNFISTTCTGTLDFAGYVLFSPVVYEGAGVTYLKTKEQIKYLISYHRDYKEKIDTFVEYLIEGANKIKALN